MSSVASEWRSLRSKFPERRAQLGLSLRVTIAALSGFAVSHLLKVPLPLWTVVTAVVLTQATFGRSVKATIDYLAGTLGGAVYAGAVAILVPHSSDVSLAGVLALAVVPLAFLGGVYPSLSVAPLTGVLVLLVPRFVHVGPIESAVDRMLEVAVGGIIALAVSLLVLPARAHSFVIEGAARTLNLMAGSLPELFGGVHPASRCGCDRAYPGQHWRSCCADAGKRRRGEARAHSFSCRRARSWTASEHAHAAASRPRHDWTGHSRAASRVAPSAARTATGAGRTDVS